MYRLEGTSPYDVDKPIFNTNKKIQRIVDFLAGGHKPGWFRFGADLLGLAGPSQKALADAMEEMVKKTRNDDRSHSLVQGYAGMWGYPTFFAATCPRSHSRREAIDKLGSHMAAKKHQMQSDRSLGVLLDLDGQIVYVGYMNDPTNRERRPRQPRPEPRPRPSGLHQSTKSRHRPDGEPGV